MVSRQEEFNARVNLLVMDKMGNIHHIYHNGLRELLNPWLGDQVRLLSSYLCQVSVGCEHIIVIYVVDIKVIILQ